MCGITIHGLVRITETKLQSAEGHQHRLQPKLERADDKSMDGGRWCMWCLLQNSIQVAACALLDVHDNLVSSRPVLSYLESCPACALGVRPRVTGRRMAPPQLG